MHIYINKITITNKATFIIRLITTIVFFANVRKILLQPSKKQFFYPEGKYKWVTI